MGFINSILEQLGAWGAIYGIAPGFFWLLYGKIWSEDVPRQQWIGGLLTDNRSRRYKLALTQWLDALDRFLGNHEFAVRRIKHPDARDDALHRNQAAWSWGLLDFALLLAIAYPVFSLLVQWAVTGTDGRLGTLTVLPAEPEWWRRYGILGLLALSIVLALASRRAATKQKRVLAKVFAFGAIAVAGAVAIALSLVGAIAAAGAVAIAVAGAGAGVFANAGAGALAGVFAVAIAAVGAVAGAVAGAGALALSLVGAIAAGGAVAGAVAFDLIRQRIEGRSKRPSLVLVAYVLVLYVILIAASIHSQPGGNIERVEIDGMLLFLGFLPLVNALADFSSTGLTRALLRKGTQPGQILALWSCGDFIAGAVVFVLLGWALIATVWLVQALGGPALIDLALIFGDAKTPGSLRADPHSYWWLYATFLSTLLPTFLHLMLGVFSLPFFTPRWLRKWIAKGLEEAGQGDGPAGRLACLVLCLTLAFAFTVTAAAISYGARGLWYYHPQMGEHILWAFEWFARAIGALP